MGGALSLPWLVHRQPRFRRMPGGFLPAPGHYGREDTYHGGKYMEGDALKPSMVNYVPSFSIFQK
jgi:hypothetical protein